MTGEYFCRPRENLHCFYITKDNVEEFANNYGCKGMHMITIADRFAYAKYNNGMVWHIPLNAFMVYEHDGWKSYTQKEFDETYEITI